MCECVDNDKITPEVNGFILNRVNEMKAHMGQNDNQTEESCLVLSIQLGNRKNNLFTLSISRKVTKQLI